MDENWSATQQVTVSSSRLRLVPYESRHVQRYQAWFESSAELRTQMATEPFDLAAAYKLQREWADDNGKTKAALIVLDGQMVQSGQSEVDAMIGDVTLSLGEADKSTCEISLMIAQQEYRGKGLGKELLTLSVCQLIPKLFPCVTKVEAKIQKNNLPSLKLFRAKGFLEASFSSAFEEYTLLKNL